MVSKARRLLQELVADANPPCSKLFNTFQKLTVCSIAIPNEVTC